MTLITSIAGIRGTIGGNPGDALTPSDIVKYTAAYAQWVKDRDQSPNVVIGRDGRVSGPMVRNLVAGTLRAMGVNVIDLGLSTTPTVEMAVTWENAGGGIIITASHNPRQWNALKLLNNLGEFLSEQDGQDVLHIAETNQYKFVSVNHLGHYQTRNDAIQQHIDAVLNLSLVTKQAIQKRDLKIVVDCVNSTGGIAVPALLRSLGVENIVELSCTPNGNFPHNPEPLPENLTTLANEVDKKNADLGIAVDPDVDRLAFVCDDGSMFGEEYTLVSVADYVLSHEQGSTVSHLSSTSALQDITEQHGCSYFPSAVGEVNVVAKMKEKEAITGGEGNGGVIYPALHYGRDALVGIALFLSHLALYNKPSSVLRNKYPDYQMVKNKVELSPDIDLDALLTRLQQKYQNKPAITEDGLKLYFDNDWVHLRKSNTEPVIRIYAESTSETTADNLMRKLMEDLKSLSKGEEAEAD
ncbi:MAG: phosphoglucosamine mutase [Bacteroidetes bacterium SW_11_45_7]|nr:MAG: phosphoglucosamine mutase [Bacteroidetes bacterium SW_11_45_7]